MTEFDYNKIEKAKEYLVKKDKCENFFEYSVKHDLIKEVTKPWLIFFKRTVRYERDMVETFEHIFKAIEEMENDKN